MEGFKETPDRHRYHTSVLIVTVTLERGLIPMITNTFHKDLYLIFFSCPSYILQKYVTFGTLLSLTWGGGSKKDLRSFSLSFFFLKRFQKHL